MRLPRLLTLTLLAGVFGLWSAGRSYAQEVQYWPLSKISFPLNVAEVNRLNPRPSAIRFYAAPPGKEFKLVDSRKPSDLDEIIDTKDLAAAPRRGFSYTAPADGEVEFAVQYEFADGTRTPVKLAPQYRIRFDTRPPAVRAVAVGANGIRWQIDDDTLVEESIRVEGRYVGNERWEPLATPALKADDVFKWWDIPPGKTLEVRVYARDRAGHEGRSLPIKLTSGGAGGGGRADDKTVRPTVPTGSFGDPVKSGPMKTGTGFGGMNELPGSQPKIEYIGTNKLRVSSKVTQITRSGVKAAQLFVLEQAAGPEWKAAGRKEGLTITTESPDADRLVGIDYEAPRDGLYGFVLQPISGANTKLDDPRPGDVPQYLVEVDTTKPEMRITKVNVTGSGLNGPLVEIEWEAKDKNLTPEPIVLEYSVDQQTWKAIVPKTTNTGRYTWEITDKKLWKFWVRGTASDLAGNTAQSHHADDKGQPQPVLVDLDKPSGNVDRVNPNGPSTVVPGRSGISLDAPGGGVQGVSSQPGTMPGVTPVVTPTATPGLGGRVAPPSPGTQPAVQPPAIPGGPPVPDLPKPGEPKPMPIPTKPEPKKDDKRKVDAELPPLAPGSPVSLPSADVPPAVVPIPSLPPLGEGK
ncbi:MAG: hypothetical protein MUF18_12780 [Fimbriiglobus sp.]|jgi:hypothetical protein|nr:hypothetical protein [Fimbriiglobus sp.]